MICHRRPRITTIPTIVIPHRRPLRCRLLDDTDDHLVHYWVQLPKNKSENLLMVFFGDVGRFEFKFYNPLPKFTGKTLSPLISCKKVAASCSRWIGANFTWKEAGCRVDEKHVHYWFLKNACSAIFKNSSIFPRGLTEGLLSSDIWDSPVWRYFEDTERYIKKQLVSLYYATVKEKKEPSGMENKILYLGDMLLNFRMKLFDKEKTLFR